MAYQSLYRKYRPQSFADVVGQGHVTRTLQNALSSGRVAHGYLFTGTRGTAKTTVARLLAKALNCQSATAPTPEPCNRCEACTTITNGGCIDVIEMDAASHRGVADIEDVRKSVGYGPMEMRYKVFIIDEAHQLSSDAKDAFLKTLEEPPANVVFILATTEPQSIPVTIRSRCQQFDFKRGSLQEIASRIRYVLDHEGVGYSDAAVALIARGAEGSYRDSLSLLEQVLAYSPERITPADVDTVLGTMDADMLGKVTGAVARKDAPAVFALAGQMLDAGKEARTLLRTLSAHFRDLLLVTIGGPAVAQEMTPDEVARFQEEQRVCRFSPQMLLRAMEALNEAQGETRWNNQHRLLVELTFLKLMTLDGPATSHAPADSSFSTAPILFASAAPAAGSAQAPSRAAASPPRFPERTAGGPTETPAAYDSARPDLSDFAAKSAGVSPTTTDSVSATELQHSAEISPSVSAASHAADSRDEDAGDIEDEYGIDDQTPSLFDEAMGRADIDASPTTPVPSIRSESLVPDARLTEPVERASVVREAKQAAGPEHSDFAAKSAGDLSDIVAKSAGDPNDVHSESEDDVQLTLNQVVRSWPQFLREAERISKQTEVMMSQAARPVAAHGRMVTLAFSARMNYDRMNEPTKLEFVRKLLARCLGIPRVTVRFVLDDNAPAMVERTRNDKRSAKRDPIAAIGQLDAPDSWSGAPQGNGFEPDESGSRTTAAVVVAYQPVAASTGNRPSLLGAAVATDEPTTARGESSNSVGDMAPIESEPATNGTRQWRTAIMENALVQETLQVFGGEIVEE